MAEYFEDRHFVGAIFVDGEAVLFDRRSHATHALDASAAAVYRVAVTANFDKEKMLRALEAEGVDPTAAPSSARVEQSLAELRDAGLLAGE